MPPPKLRAFEIREIRALYARYLDERSDTPHDTSKHQTTLAEIGKLYGVSWLTVYRVGERLSYVHVPDEKEHEDEGRSPEQITPRTAAKRRERERLRKYQDPPQPRRRDRFGRFLPNR
jgi:hypothetical protein